MLILYVFVCLCIKYYGVKSFNEVIEKNDVYKNNVFYVIGKFVWDNDFFRGFFKKIIDGIVKYMDEIFQEFWIKDIKIIVMVGGFFGCILVQDVVRKNFSNYYIIIFEGGIIVVLKGVVYFGYIFDVVLFRLVKYIYGFQMWFEFNEDIYLEEKRV